MTCYDIAPEDFAKEMADLVQIPGIGIVGGCCGTTPEHIRVAWEAVNACVSGPIEVTEKEHALISSSQMFLDIADGDFELGTSIDASQDEDLLEDLLDGFVDSVMDLADDDEDEGAEVLNIKLAAEGVDEAEMTKQAIIELQNLNMLPISIQSTDPDTIREALRIVNGKAMVNVSGATEEEIAGIMPVVEQYGAEIWPR